MAAFIFPTLEQIRVITANQLPYKTGLAKLFKSAITLTEALAAADLAAIEADFTGYAAITETTLPDVYVDENRGGVSFAIPTLQYNTGNAPVTGNDIYGGWFETAGGVLLMAWALDEPYAMQAINQSMPIDLIINMYGTNQVYVSVNGIPQ